MWVPLYSTVINCASSILLVPVTALLSFRALYYSYMSHECDSPPACEVGVGIWGDALHVAVLRWTFLLLLFIFQFFGPWGPRSGGECTTNCVRVIVCVPKRTSVQGEHIQCSFFFHFFCFALLLREKGKGKVWLELIQLKGRRIMQNRRWLHGSLTPPTRETEEYYSL